MLMFIGSSDSNCSAFYLYRATEPFIMHMHKHRRGVACVRHCPCITLCWGRTRHVKIFLFQDHRMMVKIISVRCFIHFDILSLFAEAGQLYCNSTWDTVSCWPTTLAGRLAVLPCPSEVDGVRYNTSRTFIHRNELYVMVVICNKPNYVRCCAQFVFG